MPHLMLSAETTRHTPLSSETVEDLEPLRRQVSAIIDAILLDTKPDEAAVREQLRWHVANHPGRPEKALLDHLLTVSALVQDDSA
ncbi:MAG: hypothetical protein NTU93_02470 [Arthrobacter sp.]|nr:hypothetical protein [Arthrobacter sp.]